MKTKWLSKKLDYTKLRLFKKKTVKKSLNYKLELLLKMKIYPVFHIIYLKLADSNIFLKINPSKIDLDNQKIEYKIEAILDLQKFDDQPKYLIK